MGLNSRQVSGTNTAYGDAREQDTLEPSADLGVMSAPRNSKFSTTQTLETRGECCEPVRRTIEDPRLQGLINSRGNEDSQSQHDQSEPLLADLAGVQ